MKKIFAVILLTALMSFTLVGCKEKMGLNIIREIPLPDNYQSVEQTITQTDDVVADHTVEDLGEEGSKTEVPTYSESIQSLDELKEKAIKKGYTIQDLLEFQVSFAGAEVIGFNIKIGSHLMPIMKFPTQEEAQSYVDLVNMSGRFITLINGSYMSMVNVTDGVLDNPEELEILEYLLDTKAQSNEE